MILFHGSYIPVETPLVKLGRKKVDFGQGFYLTKLRQQAESWATIIAERKGRHTNPSVSSYELNLETLLSPNYHIKNFGSYSLEWL